MNRSSSSITKCVPIPAGSVFTLVAMLSSGLKHQYSAVSYNYLSEVNNILWNTIVFPIFESTVK
jgi:hypothetical protein